MSTTQFDVPLAEHDDDAVPTGLTWWGVRTVAALELRQRVRSTRWKIALVVWVVVVGAVTALTSGAVPFVLGGEMPREQVGATVFGLVVFFVLFLGLIVSTNLSATSVNGDRAAGTLATLQVTTLSAADIAVGKFGAAWLAALAFLAASVPFLAWGLALGGTAVAVAIGTILLLAVILAVVCALGLAFSAMVARTSGSAVLTSLTVAGLAVGTLILFGLSVPLVTRDEPVQVYGIEDGAWSGTEQPTCEEYTEERSVAHLERSAWLLTLNPFVIVADLTPPNLEGGNPLSVISAGVRFAHVAPSTEVDECPYSPAGAASAELPTGGPVWPWGVAVYLVLGAGALAFTIRRLRVPARTLARGTRIA